MLRNTCIFTIIYLAGIFFLFSANTQHILHQVRPHSPTPNICQRIFLAHTQHILPFNIHAMQCDLHERLGACPPLSAYITIISAFTTAPQSSLLLNILNILFISYSIEMHCDVIYVWVPAARSVRTLHSSAHLLLSTSHPSHPLFLTFSSNHKVGKCTAM